MLSPCLVLAQHDVAPLGSTMQATGAAPINGQLKAQSYTASPPCFTVAMDVSVMMCGIPGLVCRWPGLPSTRCKMEPTMPHNRLAQSVMCHGVHPQVRCPLAASLAET